MHFLFCVLFAAHLPIPCTAQPEYTLSKLSMQDVHYSVLDIEAGLKTLSAMKTQVSAFRHIVAGHGEIYTSTEQANRVIEYTIARLESILDQVRAALANGDARPATDILSAVAHGQGATITALPQNVLYNTTVQAALSILYARGEISPLFQDNMLLWQRVEKG